MIGALLSSEPTTKKSAMSGHWKQQATYRISRTAPPTQTPFRPSSSRSTTIRQGIPISSPCETVKCRPCGQPILARYPPSAGRRGSRRRIFINAACSKGISGMEALGTFRKDKGDCGQHFRFHDYFSGVLVIAHCAQRFPAFQGQQQVVCARADNRRRNSRIQIVIVPSEQSQRPIQIGSSNWPACRRWR